MSHKVLPVRWHGTLRRWEVLVFDQIVSSMVNKYRSVSGSYQNVPISEYDASN